MPSPFPGMDPYIEISHLWEDFHANLIGEIQRTLSDLVPDRYVVRAAREVLAHEVKAAQTQHAQSRQENEPAATVLVHGVQEVAEAADVGVMDFLRLDVGAGGRRAMIDNAAAAHGGTQALGITKISDDKFRAAFLPGHGPIRISHQCPYTRARGQQRIDQVTADETGGSGHQIQHGLASCSGLACASDASVSEEIHQ